MAYFGYTKADLDNKVQKCDKEREERFGDRLLEYDPRTIQSILGYYTNIKKLLAKKAPLNRCEVIGFAFPILSSPSFLNQLGFQVQAQIEETIEFKDMHRLSPAQINFAPFVSNNYFLDDGTFYFHETVNGVCYSYLQCSVSFFYPYWDGNHNTGAMLWIRYHSLTEPSRIIRPDEDVTGENIRFEICDTVPESFPAYDDLPDHVLERIRRGSENNIHFLVNYRKKTYDPNCWKTDIKQFLDIAIEKNRKAEEKAAKRALNPKPPKRKIPVEMPEELVYYPDITFVLTFGCDVTDEMTEEAEDVMRELDEKLAEKEEEGMQMLDVRKTDDRVCEITIDFGNCDPKTIYKVIKSLEKSTLDIVKIVVE